MANLLKRTALSICGLLQGTLGSYFALLGYAFAFPGTTQDSKDYEEDMFFVPWGYLMMFLWLAAMVAAVMLLRKNKANLWSCLSGYLVGLAGFVIFVFTNLHR